MERVEKFLKEAETYYLATVEGDQPRVRPFGTAHIFEGKLYIQTGKVKEVSKQIHANPKVEICAFKNGEWLRVAVLPQLSVIIVISHVPQLCFKQLPATSSIHCTFYHF